MKLKCLIVDDEPIARSIIKNHAEKLNAVKIVGECSTAVEALNYVGENSIDLMFLDIEMPEMNGMEFLRTKSTLPAFDIILTTAYSDYAVESYNFEVADYLLKPISFPRFHKSIQKILLKRSNAEPKQPSSESIFLKSDKKTYQFSLNDILFFKGYGNYVQVFSESFKPMLILEKMSELEERFDGLNFCRVHKSYLINLKKIDAIEGNTLHINNQEVPISKSYKDQLYNKIG